MREILKLTLAILFCQGVGIISAFFVIPAILSWSKQLATVTFTPSVWVMGFAWAIVYTLMGIALYLVWRQRTEESCRCTALGLFVFQLALSTLWAYLLFGLKEPLLALVEIVILFFVALATLWQFWSISRLASYAEIPYILWLVFALYLNVQFR